MALFDILGQNGQYGYLIYDCEDPGPLSYAATESIFRLCDATLSSSSQMRKIVGVSSVEELYYFYFGLNFGCGVLHADGIIDIYNIRDIIANQAPACITKNSFSAMSAVVTEKKQTTLSGSPEAIAAFQERLATANMRSINYPDYYILSGVPDYQQTAEENIICIPTSMANILAYWDMNGYPNLVPTTSDSDRYGYTTTNILYYLTAAGGHTTNSSIDPAFAAYVAANGNYHYAGVSATNPQFSYLMAEIYSFTSPCLIGTPNYFLYNGPHMTTGVGFKREDNKELVIVHDNWPNTAVDLIIPWGNVDFLFSCVIKNPM